MGVGRSVCSLEAERGKCWCSPLVFIHPSIPPTIREGLLYSLAILSQTHPELCLTEVLGDREAKDADDEDKPSQSRGKVVLGLYSHPVLDVL